MAWEKTYNYLVETLYGPEISTENMEAVAAIASIAADRRKNVTSEQVQQDFEDAIVEAAQARQAGKMPSTDLKDKIRALFLDA